MRAHSLLLFILLAGPAAAQEPVAPLNCKDDSTDCRDACTIEFGGSSRTYDKLGACLQKCKQTYDKCREKQASLKERKNLNLEPESKPAAPASKAAPAEGNGSNWDSGSDTSSDTSKSEPAGRSGVYRASDAAPDPELEPAKESESKASAKSEPAKASDPKKPEPAATATASDPLVDEEPAPAPAPKPKAKEEPPRPKPPPDPKKKDISDWDPNEK